jgi:hypothetical protein
VKQEGRDAHSSTVSWRLLIFEFTRTPRSFSTALAEDEALSACAAALNAAGLEVTPGAHIYVDPEHYADVLPHAEGLQPRHVLASERYAEAVLAATSKINGRDKVKEKTHLRRYILYGGPPDS